MLEKGRWYRLAHGGVSAALGVAYRLGRGGRAAEAVRFQTIEAEGGCLRAVSADDAVEVTWHLCRCGAAMLKSRVVLRNTSTKVLFLQSITLADIGDRLDIGGSDSSGWMVLKSGRHKNDIPGVFTLGKRNESYRDAVGRMQETGGRTGGSQAAGEVVSDQLTLIKAPQHPAGLLLGFDTGGRQLVEARLSLTENGRLRALSAGCLFNIQLPPGASVETETLRLEITEDIRRSVDAFAADKAAGCHARKAARPPAVFCTWYYYGSRITQQDVYSDLEVLSARRLPFDVFQIDDGWESCVGDWERNKKFPLGMKRLAGDIRAAGYRPGIWTSPFIADRRSALAAGHPRWLLRRRNGEPCVFPMDGEDYLVLDISHPEVLQWLEALYRTLTADWGYTYHKLDFTRAPVIQADAAFHDGTRTPVQLYRSAVQAVRRGMGEDAYLLMCGGLYDPLIGLVDGQRTGTDVLSMWCDPKNPGARSVPLTAKQNGLRYYMNHWWDNDPDALMVRRQPESTHGSSLTYGLLTDTEAQTLALSQYAGGGMVCATEPMKTIDDDRLMLLRHVLPPVKTRPAVADLFSGRRYVSVVDVEVPGKGYHTIALTNWSDDEDAAFCLRLDEGLLGSYARAGETYVASTFFGRKKTTGLRYGDLLEVAPIKPHGCEVVKLQRARADEAVVVFSNAHFSMGGEVQRLEICGRALCLEYDNRFQHPVALGILLPQNRVPEEVGAGMEFEDGVLTVHIAPQGLYRASIPLREG